MISRRAFLTVSTAFAARYASFLSPAAGLVQQSGPTYFAWESLAEGLRVARGGGGASLLVTSAGESLLVDCKGYGLGTTLRREVEADGSRLTAVVNTHHHANQTGGNIAFAADVPLIAHRRAGPRIVSAVEGVLEALLQDPGGGLIERRRSQISAEAHTEEGRRSALLDFDDHVASIDGIVPGNFGPSTVFSDALELSVGDVAVELHHFGNAHTDNDVVVWIPEHRTAHAGNLVYIDAHPLIDAPRGGSIRGWQRCLGRTRELCGPEAMIVPADGALHATTHDLDVQNTYFDEIVALAQVAFDAGMSREETVDFIPNTRMGRFANLAEPARLATNLGVAYDEISGIR